MKGAQRIMKTKSLVAVVLSICMLFTCGCEEKSTKSLPTDILNWIPYTAPGRESIMEGMIGEKADESLTPGLNENIILTFESTENGTMCYLENANRSYAFDGYLHIHNGTNSYDVRVSMLIPSNFEHFEAPLEGDAETYEYDVVGDYYTWTDIEKPCTLAFNYSDTAGEQPDIAIASVDTIDDDLIKALSLYFVNSGIAFNAYYSFYYYVTIPSLVTDTGFDYLYVVEIYPETLTAYVYSVATGEYSTYTRDVLVASVSINQIE